MNNFGKISFIPLILLFLLSGCEIIETIYEFGFWTGAILVIALVALVVFIVRKIKK